MSTNNIVLCLILQNDADWDCFKTLTSGDLEDSKSTSGGTLCIFGSHTFVPISWMCKKQTAVSHSSTEPEIISLDAGLRLDGIPALDSWDPIVAGLLCIFGRHTLVLISWMYKKQTSVSHCSTEAAIISRDAGLRIDGIPALDLWDLVFEEFHSSSKPNSEIQRQSAGKPAA